MLYQKNMIDKNQILNKYNYVLNPFKPNEYDHSRKNEQVYSYKNKIIEQ